MRRLFSYLPNSVLTWLARHWRLREDPSDGWNFWLDASYARWCRNDLKTHPELSGEDERELEYGQANDITWGA